MHIGHKKVHLMLIAQSPLDALILSHFHFQISIYHLISATPFFSKMPSYRDCDFVWTLYKRRKSQVKYESFLLAWPVGDRRTHHTLPCQGKGRAPEAGFTGAPNPGAIFPRQWSDRNHTRCRIESLRLRMPRDICTKDSEFGERQRAAWRRRP